MADIARSPDQLDAYNTGDSTPSPAITRSSSGGQGQLLGREAMRAIRDLFADWSSVPPSPALVVGPHCVDVSAIGASIPRPPSAPKGILVRYMADGLIARVQLGD